MVGSHRYAGIRQDESAIRRYDACEGTRNPRSSSRMGPAQWHVPLPPFAEPGDRKIGFVCIARCK